MDAFKNIIQNSTEMFISLVNTNCTLFSTKYFGIHRHKSSDPCLLSRTYYIISSDQSLSHVRVFATPWIAARQASLSITNSRSSLRLMSIESVMPSGHLILCRPLLLLPPIPPSIRVFSNESTLRMRWPKYWSFSFSIIPSKEHIHIYIYFWFFFIIGNYKILNKFSRLYSKSLLFINFICGGVVLVAKSCLTLVTPWTVDCQSPLSMGFPRKDHWLLLLLLLSHFSRVRLCATP